MKLKNKRLIITAILFFIIINTTYYWEGKLGLFAMLTLLISGITWMVLAFALVREVYFAFAKKTDIKHRLTNIIILFIVLFLTWLKPDGIIDFDKLSGNDVLITQREGGGNCKTILKLKDNYTFTERSICFGVSEVKGKYYLKNDTIYFENEEAGIFKSEFYEFAVVRTDKSYQELILYTSRNDTIGLWLPVIKNEEGKLKNKEDNR